MCGIVGIATTRSAPDPALLDRMRDVLRHRGPDDAGAWFSSDGRAALAHRRLAILDLSERGRQPMSDAAGEITVVFNGEVYNFQDLRKELEAEGHCFRTQTDTEVLLAAYLHWGTDCLARLDGMFAFALYDAPRRQLFLGRDRAGEKPLYYRHAEGRLVFASELKALMAAPDFPRHLDPEALEHYLCYGYVPGGLCILRGVRKLPPGHAAVYDLSADALRTFPYWELPEPGTSDASADDLLDELQGLLEESVRRRLVADVPVGLLLSGGLDSSLVTAVAARQSSRPVRTFTISFPGHGGYDEGPHARLVAQHCGTEHTELVAEAGSLELLPELARQYDEPIADSSMVPTFLVSRLIRRHATVALSGDGGDELFGGYPHYSWLQRLERYRRRVPGPLRWLAASTARLLPYGTRGRNHLIGFGRDLPWSIAHVNVYFDAATRHRLAPAIRQDRRPSPEDYRAALCTAGTPVQLATRVDFRTYLADDLMVKVDRASMLTSLEVRSPWLAHSLIEFAFRVPDRLRATENERKVLLRRLASRLLPPEFDTARKQGFSLPLDAWFRGPWGEYFAAVLGAKDSLFDARVVNRLIDAQRRGFVNTQRLFALTIFELWRQHYRVSLA